MSNNRMEQDVVAKVQDGWRADLDSSPNGLNYLSQLDVYRKGKIDVKKDKVTTKPEVFNYMGLTLKV
ncbi:hypothetical protein JRQ81_005124 [Phrynocephalus forsythii]|uniref:Uncharacterized protein n=1 Tax=Phrynocephalus forsythii TaxID=171643 RepID=A0A9Q0XHZ0_9SAUR|nr:hypothetical protein JRQ81_005124 [Phrynocephalus forsythii]